MGAKYYAELRKILLQHGCSFHRQGKGSHEVWYSPITKRIVIVPTTVKYGNTARAILKKAGIKEKL